MIRQILFRNRPDPERKAAFALVVLGSMIAVGVFVQLTDFRFEPPRVPLLASADGLVQTKTAKEAARFTTTAVVLPSETYGAEPFVFGVYPKAADGLPAGTVSIVYVRDGQRFVEIFEKPGMDLEAEMRRFSFTHAETVMLGETEARLLFLNRAYVRCVPEDAETGHPGVCFITRLLVFERGGVLYTIGADGDNATDGELITMAKSMLWTIDGKETK